MYYYQPVNLLQWNIFDKVKKVGHIEPFLATKDMKKNDIMLLHVGTQVKDIESGIYAYGKIISEPYIFKDSIQDYCYNKLSVDVEILFIQHNKPILNTKDCKQFINQFRTKHKIKEECYELIERILYGNV